MGGQPNETSRAKHSTLAIIVSNCALASQRKQIKGFTYVYAPSVFFTFLFLIEYVALRWQNFVGFDNRLAGSTIEL
jgi:hypothetical protein